MQSSLTRRGVLAAGAVSALGTIPLVRPLTAGAVTPVRPVGDDLGFFQFGAVAELLCVNVYRAVANRPGVSPTHRDWLLQARRADKEHYDLLLGPLGSDAPRFSDYKLAIPARTRASGRSLLALVAELERLTVGVYINAAANASDRATRELFARLLAADTQHSSALRRIAGSAPIANSLPPAIDLELAGRELDKLTSDVSPQS